mgnify:CR=1 FL=1
MCIRDRGVIAAFDHARAIQIDGEQLQVKVMEWHAMGKFKGCLLYTSDAADERSSVDLGGRRIIKKKKNDNTEVGAIKDHMSK